MIVLYGIVALAIGYFLGAIPFGKVYVRLFTGKNIEDVGSGRSGGTNSMRAGGWRVGVMTGLSDVLKGLSALLLVRWMMTQFGVEPELLPWLESAAGVASVFGHNWSIFYNFRGGAGTGPNVGWACAVWPAMFPIGFVTMITMIFVIGWASVGSFTMALIIPICFAWLYFTGATSIAVSPAYTVGGLITLAFVTYSLRPNFVRLFRGEERVVGLRAYWLKQQASSSQE